MYDQCDLTGKRAMVCGGSQGIGRACAVEMARAGAEITLLARNEDRLKNLINELAAKNDQSHKYIAVDFNDIDTLKRKVSAHLDESGPFHILLNNTGGPPPGPIVGATPEDFLKALNRHLIGNQILSQLLIPEMKKAGYGRIINIISTSVRQPIPGLGVSNTTRAAVASWAKTLAGEVAPFGITVNNILPGFTDTERLRSLFEHNANQRGMNFKEIEKDALDGIPMGRLGNSEELGRVAVFLASEMASYVTGASIPVDGGRTSTL